MDKAFYSWLIVALLLLCCTGPALSQTAHSETAPSEPVRIAILPLSGTADADLKQKVSFSLRSKIDRDGTYEAVPGVEVADTWGTADAPTIQTEPGIFKDRLAILNASIFIYGRLDGTIRNGTLELAIWDSRGHSAPATITKHLTAPTNLRFVSEQVLSTLEGIRPFEHPVEQSVWHDKTADELWQANPNLVINGGFDRAADWEGIYRDARYVVPILNQPPGVDQVSIWSMNDGSQVLGMNLSQEAAWNNGLACLSSPIKIEPDTRYRLQFRYNSQGPKLHVFVKGYTLAKNAHGELVEREIYRRQVPPSGATDGKWVTVTDDMNPQHQTFPVQVLRIDLYVYLYPGQVLFDDVVLKAVGSQTRRAVDDAIDQPVTRPASTTQNSQ